MVDIQVTDFPSTVKPNPVENCIEYCFTIDGAITGPAVTAIGCILINDNTVFPDTFTFGGVEINVGTGPGEVNLNNGSILVRTTNFETWLNSTYPFNVGTTITSAVLPNLGFVCVEWNEAGPQPNFNFTDGDFIVFREGTLVETIPGFRFVYQLMCYDELTDTATELCPMQQRHLQIDADGNPLPICIDIHHELSDHVHTTIPQCDDILTINETMIKRVFLKYGYVQTNEETGCGVVFSEFEDSPIISVINQAINLEDGENGFEDYSFLTPNLVEFLTTKPVDDIIVCKETCEWLFLTGSYRSNIDGFLSYNVSYVFLNCEDRVLGGASSSISADGVLQIPSGPQNMADAGIVLPPGACKYTIQVQVLSSVAPAVTTYSEMATFRVDENCCCDVGVYFLDPKGGYTRVPFDCIDSMDFISSMTEICLDVQCGTFNESLMGGRSQLNSEGYTQINLKSKKYKKTDETTCLLRAFKASESKFYLFTDKNNETNNRRVIIPPGNTRIMEKDGKLVMLLSIIESQSYLSLSQN